MIKKVSESYKHNILSIALGPFIKIIEAFFDLLNIVHTLTNNCTCTSAYG